MKHQPEKLTARQAAAEIKPEQAPLSHDRLVANSAWHRIEVDAKTGHAVERPSLAYGREFKQEQSQETLYKPMQQLALASGQLAVGGGTSISLPSGFSSTSFDGQLPPVMASYAGPERRSHRGYSVREQVKSNAWIWAIVVLALFAIISVLIVH